MARCEAFGRVAEFFGASLPRTGLFIETTRERCSMRSGMKRAFGIVLKALMGLVLLLGAAFGVYVYNNLTYHDRAMAEVKRAGFVEKDVTVGVPASITPRGPTTVRRCC